MKRKNIKNLILCTSSCAIVLSSGCMFSLMNKYSNKIAKYKGKYFEYSYSDGKELIEYEPLKNNEIISSRVNLEYLPYLVAKYGENYDFSDIGLNNEDVFYYTDDDISSKLDYLTVFSRLKCITFRTEFLDEINNLPCLPSVKEICIEHDYFSSKFASVLKDCFPNLETIKFNDNCTLEPNSLEQITQLKYIKLNLDQNCDIDFSKLTFLDELEISGEVYSFAISFNYNEYMDLINNGVNVKFESEEIKRKYIDVSKRVLNIINELNIDDSLTFDEKMRKIVSYILQNYSYDLSFSDESNEIPTSDFYQDGILYGIFFKEQQICGNYAALLEACLDIIMPAETSYMTISDNHAWNTINYNGENYYIDTTWLDSQYYCYGSKIVPLGEYLEIEEELPSHINWYFESPKKDNISKIDYENSHIPLYVPKYINTTNFYESEDKVYVPNQELLDKYQVSSKKLYDKIINSVQTNRENIILSYNDKAIKYNDMVKSAKSDKFYLNKLEEDMDDLENINKIALIILVTIIIGELSKNVIKELNKTYIKK